MSADKPRTIFSGWMVIVLTTPMAILTESDTVSMTSKSISLSSWRSLLYVVGVPLTTVRMPARDPRVLPAFPLRSSNASGFFFWGIRDEPVE